MLYVVSSGTDLDQAREGAVGEPCRKSFAPEPEARSQWVTRRRRAPATNCVTSVINTTAPLAYFAAFTPSVVITTRFMVPSLL